MDCKVLIWMLLMRV